MATYLTGPVQLGTGLGNTGSDTGYVTQSQTSTISFDATLVQNATFTLPANTQIIDFYVDVTTAYNSATSATLSAGTASGGTQYLSSIDAKSTGRKANGYSAAQLTAMANISTNTSVVVTVTSVGQPTAGAGRITILYAQK